MRKGLSGPDDLGFVSRDALWAAASAALVPEGFEELPRADGARRLRFPLPGTPARDRLTGRPGPAGTGRAILELWREPGLGAWLRARWTRPRSATLAERAWNLRCLLLASGVGTREPLLVDAREGLGWRGESLLVTREAPGVRLSAWLAATAAPGADPAVRARGLTALTAALERLARSGLVLPWLGADDLLVVPEGPACDAGAPAGGAAPGPLNRLPGVVVDGVEGGVLRGRSPGRRLERVLARLVDELGESLEPAVAERWVRLPRAVAHAW